MDKIRTTGIIERKIYGDEGSVRYYVDVDINGQVVNVKSDFYSSKTKSLPTGKKVEVDYIVSPKGIESVEIVGENIVLCRDDTKGESRILVGFGILVLAVIIIFMVKNSSGGITLDNTSNKIQTTGVIEKTVYSETGNVMYYVNTDVNGETIRVQSSYYSSKTKSLPEGKEVLVDYIVSSKGVESVEIINEDIILCKDDMAGELRVLAGFGILVLAVIIIFMVKK